MMRRRDLLAGGAAFAAMAPAIVRAQGSTLIWGSASLGSTGYVIIEALASTVNKHSKVRGSSQSTSGGAENMALIGRGKIDLGQTTSTDWKAALAGEAPYKEKVAAVQMFSYTVWGLPPIVLAESSIETLDDLAGKRMAPGPAAGSTAIAYRTLYGEAGLFDKVRWQFGSWRECFDALKNGAVDSTVALLTSGNPAPVVQELQTAHKIRVIETPADLIARAQKKNPGILAADTDPKLWPGSGDRKVHMPAFSGVLAAHPRVTPETGYEIAKAVFEHADEVRRISAELRDIRLDFATRYLIAGIPVNAGAARYFKEKGVWRDDLTIAA